MFPRVRWSEDYEQEQRRVWEGTAEELAQSAQELPVRLPGRHLVLYTVPEHALAARNDEGGPKEPPTLDKLFAGRIGTLSFEPADLSERTGEAFGELLTEKHRKVHR